MGANAVLSFLKTHIDGVTLVSQISGLEPVQAFVQPMPFLRQGTFEPLRCYIWPGTVNEQHPTMSGATQLRDIWYQPMLLHLRQTVQSAQGFRQFTALVDGLIDLIRKLQPLPGGSISSVLTDPDTGDQTQLVKIGETFRTVYDYPRLLLTEQPATLSCRVETVIYEATKVVLV